jgi:hypothetical protein
VEAESGEVVAESSSRYNVVEHFHFSIPETAEYLLEVSFDGALFGDFVSEQYGLAWSGSAAPFLPGDFTNDGSVNGADFLAWQRGESPDPLSPSDLAEWQSHYDDIGLLQGFQVNVPEPNTLLLATLFAVASVTGAGRR